MSQEHSSLYKGDQDAHSVFSKEDTAHSSNDQPLFPYQEYYQQEHLSDAGSSKLNQKQTFNEYNSSQPFFPNKAGKSQSQETRNSTSFANDLTYHQRLQKKNINPYCNNNNNNYQVPVGQYGQKYNQGNYSNLNSYIQSQQSNQYQFNSYYNNMTTNYYQQAPSNAFQQQMRFQAPANQNWGYPYSSGPQVCENKQAPIGIICQSQTDSSEKLIIQQFLVNHQLTEVNTWVRPINFDYGARFFIIKSFNEDNIYKSLKYKVWSSTKEGNDKLSQIYKHSQQNGGYPVFLFFSCNQSGQFCGAAILNSDINYSSDSVQWSQVKDLKASFNVHWIYVKDIPNKAFKHLQNKMNENKSVTNSRDTQEVSQYEGLSMLDIFSSYQEATSIFNDLQQFEKNEKKMVKNQKKFQNEQANQQQQQQITDSDMRTLNIQSHILQNNASSTIYSATQISMNGSMHNANQPNKQHSFSHAQPYQHQLMTNNEPIISSMQISRDDQSHLKSFNQ